MGIVINHYRGSEPTWWKVGRWSCSKVSASWTSLSRGFLSPGSLGWFGLLVWRQPGWGPGLFNAGVGENSWHWDDILKIRGFKNPWNLKMIYEFVIKTRPFAYGVFCWMIFGGIFKFVGLPFLMLFESPKSQRKLSLQNPGVWFTEKKAVGWCPKPVRIPN